MTPAQDHANTVREVLITPPVLVDATSLEDALAALDALQAQAEALEHVLHALEKERPRYASHHVRTSILIARAALGDRTEQP